MIGPKTLSARAMQRGRWGIMQMLQRERISEATQAYLI